MAKAKIDMLKKRLAIERCGGYGISHHEILSPFKKMVFVNFAGQISM